MAGFGPDASPFFRIFNPQSQAKSHDPAGAYEQMWIAEGQAEPPAAALSYFAAMPRFRGLSPRGPFPAPVLNLGVAREAALAVFRAQRPVRGATEEGRDKTP